MAKYKVIAPMGITLRPPLELHGLSEDQLRRRVTQLKAVGSGKYQIEKEVSFKHGEIVGVIGDVAGSLLEALADPVTGETAATVKVEKKTAKRRTAEEKRLAAAAAAADKK